MQERPNILLIITDQHRADHLGCYGNSVVRTPNIDALAAHGTRFERFYVASPICMPNRGTLMTGRMPSLHGVRLNGVPLSLRATTFTHLLVAAGYRTALIGKSHLQNMTDTPPALKWAGPARMPGLEEASLDRMDGQEYQQEREGRWAQPAHDVTVPFYGYQHVELSDGHGDQVFGHYSRWLAGRTPNANQLRGQDNAIPDNRISVPQAWRTRVPEELYPTSYIAERTEELLAAHARKTDDAPFFLTCSFPDPHHPFTPPGRYWDMYDPADMVAPSTCHPPGPNATPLVRWLHEQRRTEQANLKGPGVFAIDAREAREAMALTYGMITMIDDAIGRIMRALETNGLARDTLVIFTSDHGDLMGDHGLLLKNTLHYQGLIRVPFIWHETEDAPAAGGARVCRDLAGTLDIARTLLERVGITPFNGMQGRNLLPLIAGTPDTAPRAGMLIEEEGQRHFGVFPTNPRCRTLVTGRWRLTLYAGVEWGEMYDLQEDPQESRNLWSDSACAATRSALLEQMIQLMMDQGERSPMPYASA